METRNRRFVLIDQLYILLAVLPLAAGMVLKVLTTPASSGIEISGARIYFTIPMPIQELPITESQVNSWLVMLTIFWLCRWLVHGAAEKPGTKRQILCEWIIEKTDGLIAENMGEKYFSHFGPFIAAIMALSAFSSLITLIGLYTPTSDLNVVAGWAILVFILITYYKNKCGFVHYLASFADPALLTPLNVISEVATPISMAFRHYGNVLSGSVISVLVAAALQGVSSMLLGWLPGALGSFPLLQIGIPAVLSIYFDVFSGLLQAFIFAMLTMLYIGSGFPADDWELLQAKKERAKATN